jgi:3-deoxy-D-manno-octulosonic-acid transferase
MIIERHILQFRYVLHVFVITPITFLKKVVFGRDRYWRQYFWSKWGFFPKDLMSLAKKKKTIWIDVLGGGEVTQIVTFTKLIKSKFPQYNLFLSTNNPYPFKFAKSLPSIDFVFDIPWDIPFVLRRALKGIKPSLLIVVDQVRFPVILKEAKRLGIKTALISAALAGDYYLSGYMKRAMAFKFFHYFDRLGLINEEARSNYLKIGAHPDKLIITGDMKFDLDYLNICRQISNNLRSELKLKPSDFVFVAGSIHLREDTVVLEAYSKTKVLLPDLKLVLVPRYLRNLKQIERTIKTLGLRYIRRSQIESLNQLDDRIILVDTFGELNKLFSLASVMFIGNSIFPRDRFGLGQNIVEPLLYRRPIFFGKYMSKWKHITDPLKKIWPKLQVENSQQIFEGLIYLKNNPQLIKDIENKCQEIIDLNKNAVNNNFELVCTLMEN